MDLDGPKTYGTYGTGTRTGTTHGLNKAVFCRKRSCLSLSKDCVSLRMGFDGYLCHVSLG
jgi:hypothetical protein